VQRSRHQGAIFARICEALAYARRAGADGRLDAITQFLVDYPEIALNRLVDAPETCFQVISALRNKDLDVIDYLARSVSVEMRLLSKSNDPSAAGVWAAMGDVYFPRGTPQESVVGSELSLPTDGLAYEAAMWREFL
jgi:hypothetical protein